MSARSTYNVYALNATTGALLWNYTTGGSVYSSPAVANGVVYVGSDDFNVYALNAITGAKLWSYATGGFLCTPRPPWRMGWFISARADGNCICVERQYGCPAVDLLHHTLCFLARRGEWGGLCRLRAPVKCLR